MQVMLLVEQELSELHSTLHAYRSGQTTLA